MRGTWLHTLRNPHRNTHTHTYLLTHFHLVPVPPWLGVYWHILHRFGSVKGMIYVNADDVFSVSGSFGGFSLSQPHLSLWQRANCSPDRHFETTLAVTNDKLTAG